MELNIPPLPPSPPKYSKEEREEYLRHWRASGISGSVFAKTVGIPYNTFKHWMSPKRKKLPTTVVTAEAMEAQENHPPLPPQPPLPPSFVSIRVEEKTNTAISNAKAVIEIHYANGSKLNIYQIVPVEYLRELLK